MVVKSHFYSLINGEGEKMFLLNSKKVCNKGCGVLK